MNIIYPKYFTPTRLKQTGVSGDKIRTSCHFSFIESFVIPQNYVRNLSTSATACLKFVVRDSSVDIATPYGTDWFGDRTGGGDIFCTRPDGPWGPTCRLPFGSLSPGYSSRCVALNTYPYLSQNFKKKLRLFFYFLSGLSWSDIGWILLLLLLLKFVNIIFVILNWFSLDSFQNKIPSFHSEVINLNAHLKRVRKVLNS
jgi:hypothetical protein